MRVTGVRTRREADSFGDLKTSSYLVPMLTCELLQGALPQRQRDHLNQWRGNHAGPSRQGTRFEKDTKLIQKLMDSGRVNPAELCSYRAPEALLQQGVDAIHRLIDRILDIANDMAYSRRTHLDLKLSGKNDSVQAKELQHSLAVLPAKVQELQGDVEGLGGRSLKIPYILLMPCELQ